MTSPVPQLTDADGGRRGHGDAGVAGWEILPLGLLVFVVGGLLVANAWAVIDAKMIVAAAAREAGRAYVEAPPLPAEAHQRARAAATSVVRGHGRDPDRLDLVGPGLDAPYRRCQAVTFVATYPVPAITLPWIGGYGKAFEVRAVHTEIIDPYRREIPGGTACD